MMSTRLANLLGFCACVGLLGFALFAQYVLRLEPCPLCIFQRVGIFGIGVLFGLAAIQGPKTWGRKVYAIALGLVALATMGVSLRHLYIQSLPAGSVASCGASLDVMLKFFPLNEVVAKVLTGSGECAKVDWRLLGLSMPAWVLIAALGLGCYAVWANLRRPAPTIRF
jgi:protein dithiol:quinone oxidoreductase